MEADDTFASVICPTRGRPAMLRRALESVRAQSLSSWEVIVVDDGDGDGVDAALALGDARIRAVRNRGRGQVDARTTAIGLARGRMICWLDDDDWWDDRDHLSLLRDESRSRSAFYFRGGWIVFEGRGASPSREVFDHPATATTLLRDNTILTSSIAYPRRVHRELGALDRSLEGYCDWDLMLRMCACGLVPHKLPGLGVCYSVRGDNASTRVDEPRRLLGFQRFVSKHRLDVVLSNHVNVHRALADAAGRRPA